VQFTAQNLQIFKVLLTCTKGPCNIFMTFFLECGSSGSGQSHTDYISCIFEATFLPHFAKQERGYGVPNVLLIQLGDMGERCKLPQRVQADPGR